MGTHLQKIVRWQKMVKKIKRNISIDPDVWNVAGTVLGNRSEWIEEQLRKRLGMSNEKSEIETALQKKLDEVNMLQSRLKQIEELEKQTEALKPQRNDNFDTINEVIQRMVDRLGVIDKYDLIKICNHNNVDPNEYVASLDPEIQDLIIEHAPKTKETNQSVYMEGE